MNKLFLALIALCSLAAVSAVSYNYDSSYMGSYQNNYYRGSMAQPYLDNHYAYDGYYYWQQPQQRTCLGSGCRAASAYAGGSYARSGRYGNAYSYGSSYSTYGYNQQAARICRAGGSCRDAGTTRWY